jgi:hypothetical protein
MIYGYNEKRYAEPFAEALANDPIFRSWVLRQTIFANYADEARLLHREMHAQRNAKTWWGSHFTEACRCTGCSGQETDLLAIFETAMGLCFALHTEVKHPGDKFKKDTQAAAYPVRAQCWVANTPKNVLPQTRATTVLLCSARKLSEYAKHLRHFECVITFEDIANAFPDWAPLPATPLSCDEPPRVGF